MGAVGRGRPTRRSAVWAGLLTACLLAGPLAAEPARADVTTVSVDPARTGWDPQESALGPADVQSSDFGRQFSTAVDGQVYAQPLVAGGLVVAATENDKVYGIDATTGAVSWRRDLGTPWPAATVGCGDLVPDIGVTSTPVLDPATRTVYLTAKVNDGPDAAHPHWYVHALDLATGAERSGWPVTVAGAPSNDPTRAFNPETAMQRPGLLLLDGRLFIGFASHCDFGPYVGYVASLNTSTRALRLWATEDNSANGMAGVWMGGGGLVSDGPGRIIFSTGNGVAPAPAPGDRPPGQLSESVVRLAVNSDGTMAAQDFFSPANAATLDQNDTDLGSGGPVALPDGFGTAAHPHLLVQIGKDGRVFLLDRDHLGGRAQGPGGTDAVVGVTGPFEGVWGHPAVYGGEGGWVYAVGSRGPLRAYRRGVDGSGQPVLSLAGTSAESFGYTSGSPVVTSDRTTAGSAVVWAVYSSGSSGADGTLRAYRAVPDGNGTLELLHSNPSAPQASSRFRRPAAAASTSAPGTGT
ncbi:PQQ-binding-like beta-propeller repeat protein [Streptacidiphilus monticola]